MTDDRSHNPPQISLIVVTYNSAALLPAFFAALATTMYAPYDVLIVDNASRDGTPRLVAEQYPQAQLLANDTNLGFGRACNQGARAARGDILVFLNPDVIATPAWLAVLTRTLAENPDAAIICPATLYPDEGSKRTLYRDSTKDEAPARSPSIPRLSSNVVETAAVPGCAMVMPRAAWQALGGFDEQIFLYWEDTELCWRAWLLGWRVLADLNTYVYHARGGSGGGAGWDVEQTQNGLYTYLKLMRWRVTMPFIAWLAIKTFAKLALRRQPRLLTAWAWNFKHLGLTLAQRRAIAGRRRGDPARIERLIADHTRRGRAKRQERRRMVYYSDAKQND